MTTDTAAKPSVAFVCVHNAGRSQMAAGWLTHLADDTIEVRSAGELAELVDRCLIVDPPRPSSAGAASSFGADVARDDESEIGHAWTVRMRADARLSGWPPSCESDFVTLSYQLAPARTRHAAG